MMEIEFKKEDIGRQSLRLEVIRLSRLGSQKLELFTKDIETFDELKEYKVIVEGVWTQGHIIEHSILHLINPHYDRKTKIYSVNNTTGLLVIEPDNLLTCTLVASSLFCERKTWLNNVFLGQVGTNRAMLVGTLVHEVFQYGVKNKCHDIDKLTKYLDELLDDATVMLEIYSVELTMKDVRNEAISYISSVKEWVEKYMLAGPTHPLTNDSEVDVKVIGISDIEENVWSTKYGLKGKIDVTGIVKVYDKRTRTQKEKRLPLELKTGNPNLSSSHAAQVSLYSMMIEDRYAETNQGLVIYLKDKAAMHNVTLTHNIKRDLIQRRNQLNYHLKNYYYGPEAIDQPRMCRNCDRLTECVLMTKLYDGDLDRYSGLKSMERDAIGHLDSDFESFFKKYHEKLSLLMTKNDSIEPGKRQQTKGSFWTYSSLEAENKGTGLGKLQAEVSEKLVVFRRHPDCKENLLIEDMKQDKVVTPRGKKLKIDDYFKPQKLDNGLQALKMKPFNVGFNFSRCRMAISLDGESINMDGKNSSTALAIGFVNELTEDKCTLKIYEGSMEHFKPELLYRIDKIEKRTNLDIERLVLIRLSTREDFRCDRVRQLLLDEKYVPKENIDVNLFVLDANFEEISELDAKNQELVVLAISTDNYYIISESKLSPDTSVTRLISVMTRVICCLDRTVLIVAQNIDQLCDLMKILQKNQTKFIIIDDGKSTKARFTYASNLVKVPQNEQFDLTKKFDSYIRQHEIAPVVVTTHAMSIGGLQFTRRTFDYCIVYDCDKTELLVSLAPMFNCDRHIMIDVRSDEGGFGDIRNGNNGTATGYNNGDSDKATGKSNNETTSSTTNTTSPMISETSTKTTKNNTEDRQDIYLGEHLRMLRPNLY